MKITRNKMIALLAISSVLVGCSTSAPPPLVTYTSLTECELYENSQTDCAHSKEGNYFYLTGAQSTGGYYSYDDDDDTYIFIGGPSYYPQNRTVYYHNPSTYTPPPRTTTIYRPSGRVHTPSGSTPQPTASPSKPKPSTATKGPVKGRGNNGFGSTFKSTGKGGK